MMLVDKDIKRLVGQGQLITESYNEDNVTGISYDLSVDTFEGTDNEKVELAPSETIIIRTKEKLKMPYNITGRIGEKNSLLRLGIKVDGPQYFPGHETYAFLRVHNLSGNIILLSKDDKIAQIFFEELKEVPELTYDKQKDASFNNEEKYVGFGNYENKYRDKIKSFDKTKEEIENMSEKIYANVLTLMGIIVAIFSLISINSQAFTEVDLDSRYIIAMNLSITFCITVMLGLILLIVNRRRSKGFYIVYSAILVFLLIATIAFCRMV